MLETRMARIYLYAAPEDHTELLESGARWDADTKRWYVDDDDVGGAVSRWMGGEAPDADGPEFAIASEEAFVAAAQVPCATCGAEIEVICVHLDSGVDLETGGLLSACTVSNVSAVDGALAGLLRPWPQYRYAADEDTPYFANHCPHCGGIQGEERLHTEPGDVFFGITRREAGTVRFTRLGGSVRLSGDFSFGL